MKYTSLFPLLLFFALLSVQSDKNKLVEWTASTRLEWSDFSGAIDTESPYDAWTYSGIDYTYTWYYEGDVLSAQANTYAFFDPSQSWVKPGKQTPELLAHEQLHFDLAQLYCLKFEKAVLEFEFIKDRIDAEMDSIYQSHFDQLMKMQIAYDEETAHHANKKEQAQWYQLVHEEIERL